MNVRDRLGMCNRRRIVFGLAVASLASWLAPIQTRASDRSWDGPFFGFNAKGTLDVAQQVAYASEFFDRIPDWITPNLTIRVTGGAISQTTYAADWTDDAIVAWTELQQHYRLRFIYVVNGNDTPANQRDLIQRWLDAGVRFDFLEMMNEYYLPKFAQGKTDLPEVSRQVTPESYASEILPAFWSELDAFQLPFAIIFAPSRSERPTANEAMNHWNTVMLQAMIETYPDRDLHATLHLYTDGNTNAFDYDQIERLRQALPAGRRIAITEAGVIDKSIDSETAGRLAVEHYQNIVKSLQPGDYLLDQVLYNPARNNNTTNLNPEYGGITPKGEQILQFVIDRLGSPAA